MDAGLHIVDFDQMNRQWCVRFEPVPVKRGMPEHSRGGRSLREAQSCGSYASDDDAMPQMHDRPWPLKFGLGLVSGPKGWEGKREEQADARLIGANPYCRAATRGTRRKTPHS